MHGILSLVKNFLCACPGQIPRDSGLEYRSYYFTRLKKLSNTCHAREGSQELVGAKLEYIYILEHLFISQIYVKMSASFHSKFLWSISPVLQKCSRDCSMHDIFLW